MKHALRTSVASVLLPLAFSITTAYAQSPTFTDVPETSPVAAAAAYMVSKGYMQAAPQFKPNDKFTRAQAAKVLVSAIIPQEELAKITASSFSDVKPGSWYLSFAEAARILGIVDSAPTFSPDKPVTKIAFMKMLFKAKKIDYTKAFSDIKAPLSVDVANTSDWTYDIMRYALTASMTSITAEGNLSPNRELTRGEMAILYYRLDMYQEGRRTQALLSQTETEISNILQLVGEKQLELAEMAAVRSVLSARGSLAVRPNEPIVKAAVKVAEGFQSLVKGYKAGNTGDFDGAIAAAKNAYTLADKAKTFSPALSTLTEQMQTIAKNMANEARTAKAGGAPLK